uniref:G protein subunit beta 1 like n=1 Tax=Macaca mulatta TaxID=9544 RepID=F6Q9G9_MACMU
MPRGQCRQQGPRIPIWAAANYANAHPWQQMDQASPGVAYTPLVDPWIERPCCGDPVCVRTTMEQKSTASGARGGKPAERGPLAGRLPGSRPHRVDFCWVPGSDPGTFDGSPWLLDRFLAQLGDYMSFRFEHYQDNISRVCEILRRLTGRARAWAAPYLDGDLPLPDDYELFCQDLKEVVQDPNSFAEYHAVVPCPLPLASSRLPVAPQLPVVTASCQHGGPLPATASRPPVCPPRYPVTGACTALLGRSPGSGAPGPLLRVSEWPGTRLEPADTESGCHPGWPRGPVCNLAADAAPGAPAPQSGPRPEAVPVGPGGGQERCRGLRALGERGLLPEQHPGRGPAALDACRAREGRRRGSDSGDAIQDVSVRPEAEGRCQARHAHVPAAVAEA